jgi:uncharacterized transporter YbjL
VQIEIDLNKTSDVMVKIYDLHGKEIQNLNLGKQVEGKLITRINKDGIHLAKGIYFVQLFVDKEIITKKLIIH